MSSKDYNFFTDAWQANARLALDTIAMKPTSGIPCWMVNDMQWSHLEELSGNPPGSYVKEPVRVYREFQLEMGVCYIDQWLATNPLSIKEEGYGDDAQHGATTGAEHVVCDGMVIDSPEAVVEHMEKNMFPQWAERQKHFVTKADDVAQELIAGEVKVQALFGMNMVKGPYGECYRFPSLPYWDYGYENYFMAYALYPEIMERGFKIQADMAVAFNRIAARAIIEGGLPPLLRLDHDMADSRGMLVDIQTLDDLWFPHFARSIQPFLDAGIRLIWHCDGNLMDMVPRLLECGLGGFQGFQYEDGMDYEKICQMKTRDGDGLFIIGGVSVTTTLPHGSPEDVRKEMDWLVEKGPQVGLMLGCSSSVAPGVPIENMEALAEGFAYYRKKRRT